MWMTQLLGLCASNAPTPFSWRRSLPPVSHSPLQSPPPAALLLAVLWLPAPGNADSTIRRPRRPSRQNAAKPRSNQELTLGYLLDFSACVLHPSFRPVLSLPLRRRCSAPFSRPRSYPQLHPPLYLNLSFPRDSFRSGQPSTRRLFLENPQQRMREFATSSYVARGYNFYSINRRHGPLFRWPLFWMVVSNGSTSLG
ncbi:hypothetical protein C8F04DRAFT_166202 [Mycena alexandri]|uniref:Uncharacterized protein n=1 Tax=Mycena alexandri TaxID=1745969 RepID=A0AAD6S940_9AGAR|nr:hypothetical protein C8F04DRAFT_268257 [Mycena alexandri]KAJ7024179.1 hypothetical protein C8F04DRAFT_166202 [Mycena alexandri]